MRFDKVIGVSGSSGLRHFSCLDAGGADFHPAGAARGRLHANGLQVRIEPAPSAVIRVRDIIAELRALAADFTTFSHYFCNLRKQKTKVYSKGVSKSSSHGDGELRNLVDWNLTE